MTSDEQSIHDILKQLEAAWNASDSHRWASFFAGDASFIHIFGGQLNGHAAIEGSHRVIFDTIYKGSRLSIESRNIRFVRPDVAVVFAQMHLALAQGAPMPDSIRVQRWSWSKSKASGRLSSFRTRASRKYLLPRRPPHGWLHKYTRGPAVQASSASRFQRTLLLFKTNSSGQRAANRNNRRFERG